MPGSDVAARRIHGLTSIGIDGRVQEAGGYSLFQNLQRFSRSTTYRWYTLRMLIRENTSCL